MHFRFSTKALIEDTIFASFTGEGIESRILFRRSVDLKSFASQSQEALLPSFLSYFKQTQDLPLYRPLF